MTLALAEAVPPAPANDRDPPPSPDDRRLDWLVRQIAENRFLPVPPSDSNFAGDGDFRAIGAEFLRHFVRLGGLAPDDAVLEIGCGIGRMALPLTQYLTYGAGRYDGIDVVAEGIRWCAENIAARYDNFAFRHIDFRNELYNPEGRLPSDRVSLPFAAGSVDFVLLTSVFTHLPQGDVAAYLKEVARLLRPSGRCFVSLFLMNDAARRSLSEAPRRLPFDPAAAGPEFHADPTVPLGAVAYDESFFLQLAAAAGLALRRPIAYGHWSGRQGDSYQDICLLGRAGAEDR